MTHSVFPTELFHRDCCCISVRSRRFGYASNRSVMRFTIGCVHGLNITLSMKWRAPYRATKITMCSRVMKLLFTRVASRNYGLAPRLVLNKTAGGFSAVTCGMNRVMVPGNSNLPYSLYEDTSKLDPCCLSSLLASSWTARHTTELLSPGSPGTCAAETKLIQRSGPSC